MNGTKYCTEAVDLTFISQVVEERSVVVRSISESRCGRSGSENVGLSSENMGENPMPRNPKDSSGRLVRGGLVGT